MRRALPGRGRQRARLVVFAVLALAALGSTAVATADEGDSGTSVTRFQKIDASSVGGVDGTGIKWLPASLSTKQVSVMLQLAAPPVAARGNLNASQRAAVRASLKASQDAMAKDIQKAGGTIVGQTQDAYNGVLVHAQQKDLPALASVPGVSAIQPVGLYARPTNTNGVPLIGAPTAWGRATSLTGQGVNIGIIDTGIDYTHADFGGPGTEAAFSAAKATNTQPADPSLFGPSAPKVKGGFDFAGDNYDANVAGSTPQPDPNPLDCNGHGSHVAGTAAGFGVDSHGNTYTGPYNATTVSGNSWTIGPGVAPKANVYSYRVFGCAGSTDLVILAINQAVADHVDVISMSLGSPFGGSDQNDAELTAVNNAVAAGITVVAAAGNNNTNGYIVGAPSTANHALSVAASDGSFQTYPAGKFHLPGGGTVTAINANGATFSTGFSGTVAVLRDSSGAVSLGCDPNEYAGTAGKIVVVQRGTCARVARAVYGQKAGAAAVVMINNSTSLPPFEGDITSNPDTGEQYHVTIPFFGVKGLAASGTDAQALIAADGQTVTIDNTTTPNTTYKTTASFSSGGPRDGDSAAKPEITAPGVSVLSVLSGSGNKGTVESGTSMATPMTSGAAALVKQAHPTWNGDQIKAALVNTADSSQVVGYNGRVNGTGFLQADKATDTTAVATTADGLDSLSFGYVSSAAGTYTDTRTFTISNFGSSAVTYDLSVSSNFPGVVSVSPATLPVPAGGSADATVALSISPAQFAALPGADSSIFGAVTTIRGLVTAQPEGTGAGLDRLRLQWLAVPRGLSSVTATAAAPWVKLQTNNVYTSSTTVTNAGIHSGAADFYAWGIKDPQDLAAGSANDIRDVGVQSFSDGTIVFAVNGWNAASTQATQEYDIAIDLQHNGKPDYFVVGVDFGAVTSGTYDGRMAAFLVNAKTGAISPDIYVADAPMNGSTVELPVSAADLGLQAANTSFNYWVNGFSAFGGPIDTTSTATYDTSKPGVATGMFANLGAGASQTVPLWADYDKLQSAPALGWLVVDTDDLGGAASAEEVALGSLK